MSTVESEARNRFSWMWVFVGLSMLFADVFSFMSPGFLGQVMDGQAGGIAITPLFLLVAAIITAIPIGMVVLSQVLPRRAARWANIVVGVATVAYVWGAGALDLPHYVFFANLETLACLYVAWSAWRWRSANAPAPERRSRRRDARHRGSVPTPLTPTRRRAGVTLCRQSSAAVARGRHARDDGDQGLAYLSISVYKAGWVTAQLFFATWLFPLGYLVYRSGLLPRFLGVLLVLDGIAVLVWFLQVLLLPDYPAIRYPGLVVSFVAELGLALWLLVKGVRVEGAEAGLPVVGRGAELQTEGARS